jgi:hypothetical protein
MSPDEIKSLVTQGAKLKREIQAKQEESRRINALLITLTPGDYQGEYGEVAKVILPSAAIKPSATAIAQVRNVVDPDLFTKLFDRIVSWKPVQNFRSVVHALLTPAKEQKIIALCEIDSAPYVVFS